MLHQASMPTKFWPYVTNTAIYLTNKFPSKVLNGLSPYAMMYNRLPCYELLRTFGTQCFRYLRVYCQNKLQARSRACTFIGYAADQSGYLCLDISIGCLCK